MQQDEIREEPEENFSYEAIQERQALIYKKFLDLTVEAKVKGYKSSEGDETFDPPQD